MKSELRTAANVGSSWLKLAAQAAVGIVLSPLILHKLGDTAFGIWILIFSVGAYFGILDFGIRASIGRYVARFAAMQDQESLNRSVSTSLAACSVLGLLVLVITAISSHYLGVLFKIPTNFLGTARLLFLLIGTDVALGFPLSVFGCVLEGYQNFRSLNLSHICAALLRGLLGVLVLSLGGGLLLLAAVTVGLNILRHLACLHLAFRTTPVRVSVRHFDKSLLGELMSYGGIAFTIFIAESLRFQSDVVVIGALLSSAAIAGFSIAAKLTEYPASVITSLAQVFTPMASECDARGNGEGLRKMLVSGNRACALIVFPLCTALIVFGKSIIEVWVGARYLSSYSILVVLIIPRTLLLAQSGSVRILLGLGRQRLFALVVLFDGVTNLILSVMFLRHWGVFGVALGTAVPLACTSLLFLPLHLCRLLELRLISFLREAYLPAMAATLPMASTALLLERWFHPSNYVGLLSVMALAGVVYGAGLACVAGTNRRGQERRRLRLADLVEYALPSLLK
jgi:O-antigen/teichoic acid export membrane protein